MNVERRDCLRIDAPEWYLREDFLKWLNGGGGGLGRGPRAMWHTRGEAPTEYSDVFITFDHGEGSDLDDLMPEDIWQAITDAAEDQGFKDGIVWISNVAQLEDEDDDTDDADAAGICLTCGCELVEGDCPGCAEKTDESGDVCTHCGSRNTMALDGTENECHDCGRTYDLREENPRERGDDDGVEYGDPRDHRDGRE